MEGMKPLENFKDKAKKCVIACGVTGLVAFIVGAVGESSVVYGTTHSLYSGLRGSFEFMTKEASNAVQGYKIVSLIGLLLLSMTYIALLCWIASNLAIAFKKSRYQPEAAPIDDQAYIPRIPCHQEGAAQMQSETAANEEPTSPAGQN